MEVISGGDLLAQLATPHLPRILQQGQVGQLQGGESVFYQHMTAHCMYIILHGSVSVHLENKAIKDAEREKKRHEEKERKEKEEKEEEEKRNPEQKNPETKKPEKKRLEAEEGKEEAPAALFLHARSWEEQAFSHDEPHTREKGTLSTTGGKYLGKVSVHCFHLCPNICCSVLSQYLLLYVRRV